MPKRSSCPRKRLRRGLWSPDEDVKLLKHVSKYGHGCWSYVPKLAGLERGGKSCRLRWLNYLRPDLKRGAFSKEEEHLIVRLHSILGNRWSQIAARMPGRTDNDVKNFWHSFIKKKLLLRGIHPVTYKGVAEGSSNRTAAPTAIAARPTAAFSEARLKLSSAGQHQLAHVPPQATAPGTYMYIQSSTDAGTSAQASNFIGNCIRDVSVALPGYTHTQTGDFTGCLELDMGALCFDSSGIVDPIVPSSSSMMCSMASPSHAGTVEQCNDHELWMGTFNHTGDADYGAGVTLDDLMWSDCVFDARYQRPC